MGRTFAMERLFLRGVIVVVCALVMTAVSLGQVEISGRVAGLITDPSGARIPGVSVTVSGPTLFAPRTVISAEDATYLVDKLPLGDYKVTFVFPGFKTVQQNNVNVRAGFTATINVSMEVGALAETVVVTEESPTKPNRIPAVCRHYGIECVNNLGFFRRENWSF